MPETDVDNILKKTAAYIETTQTAIDKHNEHRIEFLKRANQVAGVLANRGLIPHTDVNKFVDKVAADVSGVTVWDLVEKLASFIKADELGSASTEKVSSRKLDPFERLVLFGDCRAEAKNNGMLE